MSGVPGESLETQFLLPSLIAPKEEKIKTSYERILTFLSFGESLLRKKIHLVVSNGLSNLEILIYTFYIFIQVKNRLF